MGLIVTILAGALIGWIASMIMKTNASMGALANIVAGIVGSAIGGFIMSGGRGFGSPGFNIVQIIVGVIGACVLIGILKLVSGNKRAV
ncbi:putative membrane protein YeaQ/YmgE, transglycosylase-associated protein family [Abditibacterium utsteinense]|uniref:Putative membrane protein YeaQ/YmgE, transglycosylase-associated protein family n=1 Tax=Abditibacterium utsteinense TaxID=1960156 RepID=A0A2S8SX33_9BACT|nr:GlsB/YeaQ/YmgE family stress response membrane protein [Abditibacterium utsteinense]PQV65357.1 putative membrane protein YeaQ/YmgE, transglycosylase-associated protein family [Abditibacterium utsteinense]